MLTQIQWDLEKQPVKLKNNWYIPHNVSQQIILNLDSSCQANLMQQQKLWRNLTNEAGAIASEVVGAVSDGQAS